MQKKKKKKKKGAIPHIIWVIYSVSIPDWFGTVKMELHISYKKPWIRVTSHVHNWLYSWDLRQLGKMEKKWKLGGNAAQRHVSLLIMSIWHYFSETM